MIKKETVISMQCDCCGLVMKDIDGWAISLPDDSTCRRILIRVAEKSGWKMSKEHWICPSCLEEGAN